MRLIDADALRKNAQHAKDISKWDGELLVVGLGHILSAPTIESPRDWTPCAEGLPEDREWILVTVKDPYCKPRVATCITVYDADKNQYFPLGETGNQDERIYGVIAWQKYNPEPYNPDHIRDANKKVED